MYRLTCDGVPLLDWRDNELILVNPKVKLEVNTVGEGSFTIYKNHPHYDGIKKLKSVFEVTDENGVIFRGRATGDTVDFDNGKMVDLEGAMAYFNDSVVRPFNFPDDCLNDADYIAAAESGNIVSFFLACLIDNHNSQVKEFQKMKLGRVTVTEPDNYIARSNDDYASTWETLKGKLFDSALGGYLCIRYEADGNYIDYLSEFTETNEQEIVLGENLLDLKKEAEASEIYTAIIPIGALGLTLEGLADGNFTDDIVKTGDTLYSKKAVEEYGWIYAPTVLTTWDDVTNDTNLRRKGAEWLISQTAEKNAIEASAVDLHFTDEQVESLRIYRNVNVRSEPHGIAESFPLKSLEIELLKPQNTKITVGKTFQTLTEQYAAMDDEAKKKYSKLSKTDDAIRLEVKDEIEKLDSRISQTVDAITLTVTNGNADGTSSSFVLKAGETVLSSGNITFDGFVTFTGLADGTTTIDGGCIQTGTILANLITAGVLQSKDGKTFVLDLDHGTFSMCGSGQFQSPDGKTYIEVDGDELVMYSLNEDTGVYDDKIRLGFMVGTEPDGSGRVDYPHILLGNSDGAVGMVKKFYNGLWVGNSVPRYASGNFEGMEGASGFFINTRTGVSYVVNGTKMKDVYAGAEGEMALTSENISHEGDKLSDRMPVCLTQAEYDAMVAAGTYNEDTPYLIKREA